MNAKLEKLAHSLPMVEGIVCPWFVRNDSPGVLRISTEREISYMFADYYGEFRGGYAWIHPDIEKWAQNNHGYWEWENASNIAFYVL